MGHHLEEIEVNQEQFPPSCVPHSIMLCSLSHLAYATMETMGCAARAPFHRFSEFVPERASVVHPKTTSVLRKHEHHDDDDDEDEDEDEV